MLIRYSRWDGTQNLLDFDADDLLAAMADDLMSDGDLQRALQRMLRWGAQNREGDRMPGLRDLLERLREQRRQQLDRYSMSDIIKDLQEKLQDVLKTELESITPDQRRQLEELMQSILKDQALQQELNELAMNLEELYPMRDMQRRYPFRGDEPLTLQEAMKLMGDLQELDRPEKHLRSADDTANLEGIDPEELRRLLGEESADQLEQLKRITKMLEEAGY